MPIYDYECHACGPFTALRPMAECRDPRACPTCGAGAPRTFASAPGIVTRHGAPAANEPNASSQGSTKAAHPAGCGCCMRRWPVPSALASHGGRIFSSSGPVGRGGR